MRGNLNAAGLRFGLVVSRFNSFITERLLSAALRGVCRDRQLVPERRIHRDAVGNITQVVDDGTESIRQRRT